MLRQAGGSHSPPQSQGRTNSWPTSDVPNTHTMRLLTHAGTLDMHMYVCIFHRTVKNAINLFSSSNEGDGNLTLTSTGGLSEKAKGCFHRDVAVSHFDKLRIFLSHSGNWKNHPLSTWNKLIQKKSVWSYKLVAVKTLEIILCCRVHHLISKNNSICISSGVLLTLMVKRRVNLVYRSWIGIRVCSVKGRKIM